MKTRILTLFIIIAHATILRAQQVELVVGKERVQMAPQQTQTEVKAGWRIVDIQLKDRTTRYLFRRHSSQLTDDARPTFIVTPAEREVLVDYVIIRLVEKKQYRKLPQAVLRDNAYIRIEPSHFEIAPQGKNAFVCTPREPLAPGEYILACLTQEPQGEMGDYLVYPFRIAD